MPCVWWLTRLSLRELNTQVQAYLVGARHEQERFVFVERQVVYAA